VAEIGHRVRGGASRQGREKRRRRNEAGLEARDEVVPESGGFGHRGTTSPGSRLLELGAPKGRGTPWENGRGSGTAFVSWVDEADREADEVLEGGRKAMSGN